MNIKGTSRIYASSPIIALRIDPPFDRLIFCERDPERLGILQTRCAAEFANRDAHFLAHDVNQGVEEVLRLIPQHRRDKGVLSFCFVDPYKMRNLHFETLKALGTRWVDFLVLIPSEMDAQRNEGTYIAPENRVVADFVGSDDWRPRWQDARARGMRFAHFVVEEFGRSMEGIDRIKVDLEDTWRMKNTVNRDLYRLVLYSRKELGSKLWRQAQKYVSPNRELPF